MIRKGQVISVNQSFSSLHFSIIPRNRPLLNPGGMVVWLEATPNEQVNRT